MNPSVTLRLEFDRVVQNELFRIYLIDGENVKFVDEVHGINRRTVAAAIFNSLNAKMVPRIDCEKRAFGYPRGKKKVALLGPEAIVSLEVAEKVSYLLGRMCRFQKRIKNDEELAGLLQDPTIDKVEGFLSIKKLLE
jgi:hypothetical protein